MLNKLLGLKNVIIQKKLKRAIGVYIINKLNKTNTMKCIEQNEQWELVGQEEQMEQIEHTEQDQHAEQGEHSSVGLVPDNYLARADNIWSGTR